MFRIMLALVSLTFVLSIATLVGVYVNMGQSDNTKTDIKDTKSMVEQDQQVIEQIQQISSQINNQLKDDVLPNKYRVQYVTAPQDQGERGTCWDFATIHTLESAYLAQGQEYLPENYYVKFSEQAHGVNMIDFCTQNPEKCPDTQNGRDQLDTATDGYPSWIYHFGDYLNSRLVVQLDSCPYILKDDGEDEKCDGMYEFQNASRLYYEVEEYKQLHQVNDIKKALLNYNYALPLVTELYYEYFYIPCDTDQYINNTDECTQNKTSCPEKLQNQEFNRYCYQQGFITSADAEFYARNNEQTKVTSIGAHAMSLVAYNDDYRMRYSNQKGALIVKNSWGTILGHSLQYLMGEISLRDEEYICPNIHNPTEWVPVAYEGEDRYKLRSTTWLDYVKYEKPGHFHVDSSDTYSQALDQLNLNTSHVFAINDYVQWTDETVKVQMMDCDIQYINQQDQCTLFWLPPCKFDYLAVVFVPHGITDEDTPNYAECGFYAIPYSYVDYTLQNHGLWFVDEMKVKFSDDSYLKDDDDMSIKANQQLKDAQTEYIEKKFVSHTPWLDDYTQQPRFK